MCWLGMQKESVGQFGLLRCPWATSRRSVKEHKKSSRHMEIFRSPFTEKGENCCSGLTFGMKDLYMLSRTKDLR